MSRTIRLLGCALVGGLLLLAAPIAGADAEDSHAEHELKADAKDKAAKGKAHAKRGKDHAKGKADKAREHAEGHPGPAEIADEHAEYAEDAKGRGAAMGDDMKARRDERKAIKADYDEAVEGGADRIQGKKPWWNFWGAE